MPLGHRQPGSTDDSSTNAEDETVVEPEQGNVLSHIISQLRPGADLSRVVLPTFILEPRSMLERITNFMAHPEGLLPIPEIDDPVKRFVSVVKFYLSGWHIKPPGVKKPLNPILGEVFTCYWDLPDGNRAYYISEQTSHHPPKSSYFYMAPEHNIRIDGTLKPRSRFLGNSAASLMEGIAILSFLNRGKNKGGERYILTQPNMYARGILFGKMKYELGDHSFVRCPETGLAADIEFKTKGYFGGTYNAIGGIIKNEKTGENLYELSGMWSGDMMIKNILTGKKELLFDATNAKHSQPLARPLEEQNERESQKLWYKTVLALKDRNHEVATDEKTKIEDMQREEASQRQAQGVDWHPALFRRVRGGPGGSEEGEEDLDWILNADIDAPTPEGKAQQIFAIHPILPGQKAGPGIPARGQESEKQRHPSGGNVPPAHQSQAPPPSSDLDDLIDFGQEAPPSSNPAAPAAHQSTHLQQPGAGQSIDRLPSPGAPPGLQHPLQPIQRQDTNTQEVDTFVDADDGGKGLL